MNHPAYPCRRCKTPNSTNRARTYCPDCRGPSTALFSEPMDNSPYDRALRAVERFTGRPHSEWEWKIGHPYVRATDKLAKHFAALTAGTP